MNSFVKNSTAFLKHFQLKVLTFLATKMYHSFQPVLRNINWVSKFWTISAYYIQMLSNRVFLTVLSQFVCFARVSTGITYTTNCMLKNVKKTLKWRWIDNYIIYYQNITNNSNLIWCWIKVQHFFIMGWQLFLTIWREKQCWHLKKEKKLLQTESGVFKRKVLLKLLHFCKDNQK